METQMYTLMDTRMRFDEYADLKRLTTDREYAIEKGIKVKRCNDDLFVLKYDKTKLTPENIDGLGLFRSVITDGTKIISFSPRKSKTIEDFKHSMKQSGVTDTTGTLIIENIVDGTMVNLFHWRGEWRIATRSLIGGGNNFFMNEKGVQVTYKQMFFEILENMKRDLNFDLDQLSTDCCFSFVMQHPANRIVTPIEHPALVLVAIGKTTYK